MHEQRQLPEWASKNMRLGALGFVERLTLFRPAFASITRRPKVDTSCVSRQSRATVEVESAFFLLFLFYPAFTAFVILFFVLKHQLAC